MKKLWCWLALCLCVCVPTAFAETGYLYSVNIAGFGIRSVSVIDPITDTLTSPTSSFFDAPSSARAVASDPTGTTVYITNLFDSTVSVIDAQSFALIQNIFVGSFPNAIAVSPDGAKIYVDDLTDKTVTVIDVLSGYIVTSVISLGTSGFGPSGMAISPDGSTLYVCNSEDNTISVIDTATYTITENIVLGGDAWPLAIALNAQGTKAYVADLDAGTVSVIDTASGLVTDNIPVGSNPSSEPTSIALNPVSHTAYTTNQADNTITVIDTDSNTVLSNITTGNAPESIVIKYDHTRAYVAIKNDQTIGVLDLNTNTFTNTISLSDYPLNLALIYQVTADISPAELSFSDQMVSTASSTQSITFTNSDGPPVTITNIAITGAFSQTNDCGTQLDTSASCTITVTFTPTALGAHTGTLTVTGLDTNSPHTVSLSGNGVLPGIALSPESLTFSNQGFNTASTAQTVTLTNTGTGPLSITSISISGDFSQSNTCGTSVAAGETCTISIIFTPTVLGNRRGTLTIVGNAADSPHEVALYGTGVVVPAAGCSLVTDEVDF